MANTFTAENLPTHKRPISVYIGRFQPLHHGHIEVIREGLKYSDRMVIFVGSSYQPRTIKNPFTFDERKDMLHSLPKGISSRILVVPLRDYTYNNQKWMDQIYKVIKTQLDLRNSDVLLVGHGKDVSSSYLNWFPQWDTYDTGPRSGTLNATDIRNALFSKSEFKESDFITPGVSGIISSALTEEVFSNLCAEYDYYERYKASWASAPFQPIFTTVDAIVIKQGHVLLVKRKNHPGKGLWALPGGFLNPNEELVDGAIRELEEETQISRSTTQLKNSICHEKVFSNPRRSLRGRTLTHAFLIKLEDHGILPKVKGADDAEEARWIPIGSHNLSQYMFEDHYSIIEHMAAIADSKR